MNDREALAALERAKLSGDSAYVVAALRDPVTRGLAAKYSAAMGATEAVPDLVRMLGAREAYPRSAAAAALGKLRAREALDDLCQMARGDESVTARAWAAGAVGEIGGREAIGLLSELVQDKSWVVRRAAVYALGQAGDDAVGPLLATASKRERWTRRRIYWKAQRQLKRRA